MTRLFTGIAIPEDISRQLYLMQGGIEGARWTKPENFHLTLTFIGEVDHNTAADIDDILSEIDMPAFDLTLSGTGSFAQGDDPTILWIGIDPCPALMHLQEKITRAFEKHRLPFEKRKYSPHVTMARFRRPAESDIVQFMQEYNLFRSRTFRVENFVLYHSIGTKNGTVYEAAAEYPLIPAP